MSTYNTIEPTVIDEDLLKKAMNDQVSPEIADVARKEGIDPAEVLSLRLDYKNILKIDNLWAFENLTKLQLDNNIIEKMENFNFLKNLQWLDLSFNNISVIEGLEGLDKLTDLTLFNNRISKLENMDDLVNLTVFSIGNNCLTHVESVQYLSRFENLRVLNCAGNALCKHQNYRHYVLAHIRGLKYLDYRLVDEESVAASREKYIDDLIAIEEEEKILNSRKEDAKKREELETTYRGAHIGGIDSLFTSMFAEDNDYMRLCVTARERIQDLQEDYRAKFEIQVNELKHYVLRRHGERSEEHESFRACVAKAQGEVNAEGLARLKKYEQFKKQSKMLKTVQNSRDTKEIDDAIKSLKEETNSLSDKLMGLEMQLVEQFEDVIKDFERNYTEICSSINEYSQSIFARLRELETEHHEKFSEIVLGAFERFNKGDVEEADDELRDIMSDKDTLVNAINSSHDFRLSWFDKQEDNLVSGITKDLETLVQSLHDDEIKRNRDRVCEVITYLDKCQSEIDSAEENAF